jgi:outer membrane biosynthesis protein TonB
VKYPTNCKNCNHPLYGPVKYCPFCGAAFVSVTAPSENQKLDSLRSAIDDSLAKGEFTPDIRGYIKKKGKELGLAEEVCDSFLLEALKEKRFIPKRENVYDPLSVCWYSAEKKKSKDKTAQQPEAFKEVPPKPEKPVEVKPPVSTQPEPPEIPVPPLPPPKPLFWKVVVVLGIVVIVAGLFYTKKGSFMPPGPKTEQGEPKTPPTVEQPKETKGEVVEPPKPQIEQRDSQQPPAVPNLNEEREKIRQEAEREALAKVEAEKQRQEQAVRQREIDSYLSDGRRFFENGKYELCIEKMREVIKRDNNNPEAKQYIRMASEKINNIKRQFSNPTFGGSE